VIITKKPTKAKELNNMLLQLFGAMLAIILKLYKITIVKK